MRVLVLVLCWAGAGGAPLRFAIDQIRGRSRAAAAFCLVLFSTSQKSQCRTRPDLLSSPPQRSQLAESGPSRRSQSTVPVGGPLQRSNRNSLSDQGVLVVGVVVVVVVGKQWILCDDFG